MARSRLVSIPHPSRGVYRRTGLQEQPGGTLIDARDFWPVDAKTGREMLSVRPGWADYGEQSSVNLIATLNVAPGENFQRLLITASGGTLYRWSGETATSIGTGIDTGRNVATAPYLAKLYIATGTTPKVYDYDTGNLTNLSASSGEVPTSCPLICEWANRIVLAGNPPHSWYMSRIGDPTDWLFAEDDAGSPVGVADIAGGQIGEPITSLIPHDLECLLFGTANTLSVLRGNPTGGGRLVRIANVVGPVNGTAWCKTADDWTYMLTRNGLHRMPPGCGSNPQSVSRESIPESLLNVDGINRKAFLEYDVRFQGVHIYVTGSSPEYWWYDVARGGFWPMTVPGDSILAIGRHDPIETKDESGVLVGTSQGLRRLDRNEPLGGEDLAYAEIGPVPLAPLGERSLITRANIRFGGNTDDTGGAIEFFGAASAEEATARPTSRRAKILIGTLQNNHGTCHPRIAGQSFLLRISQQNPARHISMEMPITLTSTHIGQERG